MRGRWLGGVVGAAFCVATGAVACGPHASRGGFGSGATEAAVLPLDVFPASPIMTQKYGIVEWRYFIGRSQRVVTGYRADGSAARGVQLAWFPKTPQSEAHTRLLMLDGSGAAVRRSSSGAVTGTITTLQAEVLVYAMYDVYRKANAQGSTTQGASFVPGGDDGRGEIEQLYVRHDAPGPGQTPHRLGVMLDGQNSQSCGGQLSSAWTNGVSCAEGVVGTVPTVVWGLIENLPGEVQGDFSGLDKKLTDSLDTPCGNFFNNYANSLTACAPAGCTIVPGGSPMGGSMICSDSGSAGNDAGGSGDEASAGDDASGGGDDGGGGGDDGGGAGDDGGAAVADQGDDGGGGGDDQGDDGGSQVADEGDDGGASNADDPPTDQEIQTADNEGACTSCQGGATDLDVNPDNGDVSASSPSGDPGSGSGQNSATSDTTDDPGGGTASGDNSGSSGDNGGSTGESSSGGGASSGDDSSQDQQPSQDQGTQDQGTQDQGTQDQGTQDQGTQDSSQDQSQDAIRPHHHRHHKKSGWVRLYERIVGWLND